VNVSPNGTDYHFFALGPPSNPNYVCPNWQIYKTSTSGPGGVGTVQMLPFNWQSWCQADGNSWGPSIECAGMPGEAMTSYQLDQIAKIYEIGHDEWGWPYRICDSINSTGFGTHVMGGLAWGGHTCPGPGPRAAQRTTILQLAQEGPMPTAKEIAAEVWATAINNVVVPPNPDGTPQKSAARAFITDIHNTIYRVYREPSLTADAIADAVVAKLPASSGGGVTEEQVRQAVTDVVNLTSLVVQAP